MSSWKPLCPLHSFPLLGNDSMTTIQHAISALSGSFPAFVHAVAARDSALSQVVGHGVRRLPRYSMPSIATAT